jgi:penicillin-binding protein 2
VALMERDPERARVFTRRVVLLGGAKLGLVSLLVGRLYYLQVIEADEYEMLAEENRINFVLLPPRRGRVLDRRGQELAINRQNYRVGLVPEQTPSVEETLAALSQHLPSVEAQAKRVLREAGRQRRYVPIMVADNLTWEEFSRINVMSPELPGVFTDAGETRWYPHGALTSHTVGYVAAVAENELTGDPLLELPGFRIGKSGVEKLQDPSLRGKAGNSKVEVNAFGRVIRELARKEGTPGQDIQTSLDLDLQRFATERFGEESGAAVTLDVQTGEILTLVSTPSFDPNLFNTGIAARDWVALNRHPRKPLVNKAVAGIYPPGSTFKMLVALAGLESGLMSPEQRVHCAGKVTLGDHDFHCWKKGGHGSVNMIDGIKGSCDCYFYEVARKVGVDRIAEMAHRFGLGVILGLDLPGEKAGIMPTRAWKKATFGQEWAHGETLIIGIGQGYVTVTPLQLAVMTARIATGLAVKPRLLRASPAEVLAGAPKLPVSAANLDVIRRGMDAVVNAPGGTAGRSKITEPGMAMAGKTGTSQVRRISRAERQTRIRKQSELPWEERDHALFVAYAPVEAPRYAIAVLVEHGGGGSSAAAPIAKDILLELQRSERRRQSVALAEPGRR